MEPKKLAIIGACCSRDMCNHHFVSNYKEYFDMVYYGFQTSFISLMAKPVPYNRELISYEGKNFSTWYRDIFIRELNKSFCNDLLSIQPDNLLIDFYSDVVMGVLEVSDGETYISQRLKDQKNNAFFSLISCTRELKPSINREEYLELFQIGLNNFFDFMNMYLPYTNIILNVPYFTDKIIKKDGSIDKLPEKNVTLYNDIYLSMVDIAKEINDKLVIVDLKREYYIDPEYEFGGAWIVHYIKDYYRDLIEAVYANAKRKIAGREQDSEAGNQYNSCTLISPYAFNLILNHDFLNDTLFYKYWDNIFIINKEAKSVKVDERNRACDIFGQMWTADVAVDIGAEYLISFECLVSSEVELSSDIIFVARSFDKLNMAARKDAVDQLIIPWNKRYDVWSKYICSYKPKGKYMSLGCYCKRNGMMFWKNIMLHKMHNGATLISKNIMEVLYDDADNNLIDVNRLELYRDGKV